jgi:hypothetical protein
VKEEAAVEPVGFRRAPPNPAATPLGQLAANPRVAEPVAEFKVAEAQVIFGLRSRQPCAAFRLEAAH